MSSVGDVVSLPVVEDCLKHGPQHIHLRSYNVLKFISNTVSFQKLEGPVLDNNYIWLAFETSALPSQCPPQEELNPSTWFSWAVSFQIILDPTFKWPRPWPVCTSGPPFIYLWPTSLLPSLSPLLSSILPTLPYQTQAQHAPKCQPDNAFSK